MTPLNKCTVGQLVRKTVHKIKMDRTGSVSFAFDDLNGMFFSETLPFFHTDGGAKGTLVETIKALDGFSHTSEKSARQGPA